MIESPSRTAIVESKPPAYTEEYTEKEPLISAEEDHDVEITVIDHKPITAKIRTTIHQLQRVGGFRARWRGLGLFTLYHLLHALMTRAIMIFLGFGLLAEALSYILVSLGLARLHMAWTHSLIAYPSTKRWYQRVPTRKDCRAILLPALVYAAAEQATLILPIGVALTLGVTGSQAHHAKEAVGHELCNRNLLIALRFLAVPATYIIVALAVLVPASVTLTRIEATLLPEGEETIVPFDKAAIMGDVDVSTRGGRRALFVQAWRSFDHTSRLRLVKLYAKLFLVQVTIMFTAAHLMIAELYLIGGDKLAIFFRSATAQLKLAAIEQKDA